MRYSTNWGELKTTTTGKRLFEGEFKGLDGSIIEAAIWELDKEGKQFPGFNDIRPGAEFEGNAWTSPKTGKTSIYPPKDSKGTGRLNPSKIEKIMDRKNESIERAQGNKEQGIKVSSTIRMAVDLALAELQQPYHPDDMQESIKKWRKWLWLEWDKEEKDFPPF